MTVLLGLGCLILGVWLCYRSPDPPGMDRPSTWGQRAVVAAAAGLPLGAVIAVAVLFVYACVTGQPAA